MKKITFLLCFFLPFLAYSQSIKWGKLEEASKKDVSPMDLLGKVGDNYLLTMNEDKKTHIQSYSIKGLALNKSVELDSEYEKDDLAYEYAFMAGNKVHVFQNTYYKKEEKKPYFIAVMMKNCNQQVS